MIKHDRDGDDGASQPERRNESIRARLVGESEIHGVGYGVSDQERNRPELGDLFERPERGEGGGQSAQITNTTTVPPPTNRCDRIYWTSDGVSPPA